MTTETELADALAAALMPRLQVLVEQEVKKQVFAWRWRTAEQAGDLLGISADAVRQRVLRGDLPGKKVMGRVYLDIADLDRALQRAERP